MRLIVNADDFGLNHDVNMAIVEAFQRGWITNTTIMVNMPGFDEAVKLCKEYGFFDRVGLHLNFFEGEPISEPMKNDPIFIRNGVMDSAGFNQESNFFRRMISLPRSTRCALKAEAKVQVDKYYQSGFTLNHLDSHGHSHISYAVFSSIYPEIRGFRTIRKTINYFTNRSMISKVGKICYNQMLSHKFLTTDYFTSTADFLNVMSSKEEPAYTGTLELMVHPVFIDGKLENLHCERTGHFDDIIKYYNEFELISYKEI